MVDLRRTHFMKIVGTNPMWGDKLQLYPSADVEQSVNVLRDNSQAYRGVAMDLMGKIDAHMQSTVPLCQKNANMNGFPTKLHSETVANAGAVM